VEDSSLANMESKLAEERKSDQPEPPVAITPGGEKQPWYGGMTPLLIIIAVILIALVTWVLRRRSAPSSIPYEEAVARAEAEEAAAASAKVTKPDAEGETVIQPIPEPGPALETGLDYESEPEPGLETGLDYEPEPGIELKPVIEAEDEQQPVLEPEPFAEPEPLTVTEPGELPPFGEMEQTEEPTVVFEAGALEPGPEAGLELEYDEAEETSGEGEDQGESDPEIKLDLARAYLSLGDKEASKSMLDEVLKTGNEAQQAEARQMLEEL